MAGVLAATLVQPGQIELREYPYPAKIEPGAVLLRMLASGICGTDKHTFRGETEQYAGTDHARTTPFPIIQGHENVGRRRGGRGRGAPAWDGTELASATGSCPPRTGPAGAAASAPATSPTTSASGSRTTATR